MNRPAPSLDFSRFTTSGRWLGVDFDGTLVYGTPGQPADLIGEPVHDMVHIVKQALLAGVEVRIVTARVYQPFADDSLDDVLDMDDPAVAAECMERYEDAKQQRAAIEAWCETHLGRKLRVTCMKDPKMHELWDDRACSVVKNAGLFMGHTRVRGLPMA